MPGAFAYVATFRVEEAFNYLEDYLNNTEELDEKCIKPLYQMVLTKLYAVMKNFAQFVKSSFLIK